LLFTDPVQTRYEVVRPLLLKQSSSAEARARETLTHAQTVRKYVRRFECEGMRGLFDERETVARSGTVPEAVRQEVIRLKTLYAPLHHREIATIIYATLGSRVDYKTVQSIINKHPIGTQCRLPLPKFRDYKDPYQARVEVIKLYYQGWNIQSISSFLGVSRRHIYNLLERFETEMFEGLVSRSHVPHTPARKLYFPLLKKIADLQNEYPLLGRYRLWDLLDLKGHSNLSTTTVGRAMRFNRFVYSEMAKEQSPPRPHPFKSRTWHQFWFIDHRYLIKIDGIQYYSLCILEGYSRAFLSGVVLATQARGPVLKLLYETVQQWGAPAAIVSDSGGAFISDDYRRTCSRLGIEVHYIEARQSWQNLIETHFNIQRKMTDHKFAALTSEVQLQAEHTAFLDLYNSMGHAAHQKRRDGKRTPHDVLSWVRGQPLSKRQLEAAMGETLWMRTTDRAGYVLVQNYFLYAERAANRQRVSLWLWDDTLHIDHRDEVLASYTCSYDQKTHQIRSWANPHCTRIASHGNNLNFCALLRSSGNASHGVTKGSASV
jgi:transposase